ANLSKVAYKSSLFSLFLSPFPSGTVAIDAPYIAVTNEKGNIVLDEVFSAKKIESALPKLNLSDLHLSLNLAHGKEADVELSFQVVGVAEKPGKVSLHAQAKDIYMLEQGVKNAFITDKTAPTSNLDATLHLKVESLPIALVEAAMQVVDPETKGVA